MRLDTVDTVDTACSAIGGTRISTSTSPASPSGPAMLPAIGPLRPRSLTERHAALAEWVHRPYRALTLPLEGAPVALGPPEIASERPGPAALRVLLDVHGVGEAAVSLPRSLATRRFPSIETGTPVLDTLVAEALLAPILDVLEERLGTPIAVAPRHPGEVPDDGAEGTLALRFPLTGGPGPVDAAEPSDGAEPPEGLEPPGGMAEAITLRMPALAMQALARLADDLVTPLAVERFDDLPVRAAMEIGSFVLPASDLLALAQGDVLLPPSLWQSGSGRAVALVAGGHRFALNERAGALVVVDRIAHSTLENVMADPHTAPADDADGLIEPDALPVALTFEIGQHEMSLGELRRLAPGRALVLDAPADAPVTVLANGRAIARGEIVTIGDALGVRLTDLHARVGRD